MSRAFLSILFCLALPLLWLVRPLQDRVGAGRSRIPAGRALTDTFVAELCRPPSDKETVEWESRPLQGSALAEAVRSTPEGASVHELRQLFHDVLRRESGDGDCTRVRTWVDRGATLDQASADLADSPEGRRVTGVRRLFVDTFGRDPRDWDDASLRWWVDRPLTLTEIKGRLAAQRPLVGVHYFTWYRPQEGTWRNDVTLVPAGSPRPAFGPYVSSDVDVMRRQIAQMANLDLDFVIVHVIAQSPASWANARTFFRLLSDPAMKAAVLLDGLHADTAAVKAKWVEQAKTEFSARPTYFSFHGQPLIMLFSASLDLAVPGVELRNVYWNDRYDPGHNTFNNDLRLDPRDWPFWAPSPQPIVNGVVPVIPGYIDTDLGRERTMEHPRENGQLYHAQWRRALALRPELILIYSWNEYFERTAIEATDAWGDQYLRWTACYVAHAHQGTRGDCS